MAMATTSSHALGAPSGLMAAAHGTRTERGGRGEKMGVRGLSAAEMGLMMSSARQINGIRGGGGRRIANSNVNGGLISVSNGSDFCQCHVVDDYTKRKRSGKLSLGSAGRIRAEERGSSGDGVKTSSTSGEKNMPSVFSHSISLPPPPPPSSPSPPSPPQELSSIITRTQEWIETLVNPSATRDGGGRRSLLLTSSFGGGALLMSLLFGGKLQNSYAAAAAAAAEEAAALNQSSVTEIVPPPPPPPPPPPSPSSSPSPPSPPPPSSSPSSSSSSSSVGLGEADLLYDEQKLLSQNRRMQEVNRAPQDFPGFVREGFKVKVIVSEDYVRTDDGLIFKDYDVGDVERPGPSNGQQVVFHYTAYNEQGRRVDTSYRQGKPTEVRMGNNVMIPGFEIGLKTMHVGGKRRLVVPPELGPPVGPSTFFSAKQFEVFDVELLAVNDCKRKQFGFLSNVVCEASPS